MSNTIKIKHGDKVPTTSNLAPFELGYVKDGALYINNDGTIQQLTGLAASGLVNSLNYLKLPAVDEIISNTNRILVANSIGVVFYKTAAGILSEIEALPLAGGTLTGPTTFNGAIIVGSDNYGITNPNDEGKTGEIGQLYFVLTE